MNISYVLEVKNIGLTGIVGQLILQKNVVRTRKGSEPKF